jgi:biopolymer transport protein ExbD
MQFSHRTRRKATINIISLVDVVFLLLIFFTVSATFMDQPALKIDLPESGAEPPEREDPEPMTVYLTKEGELYFGDQPIRFEDLAELISGEIREGASRHLSIKADKEVTHGRVIQVMDMARQKGVQLVTIATQKRMSEK